MWAFLLKFSGGGIGFSSRTWGSNSCMTPPGAGRAPKAPPRPWQESRKRPLAHPYVIEERPFGQERGFVRKRLDRALARSPYETVRRLANGGGLEGPFG